jgi:hypothetical protein|tara:strand:+ start:443 stop:682 length:240 start_codon:yes stop_codon:yes gene_type:complete
MQIELSVKNIVIAIGLITAACGNVFYIGKLYSDFELFKTEIAEIKADQNILELKQELMEMNYRIKSLRFEMDGTHQEDR